MIARVLRVNVPAGQIDALVGRYRQLVRPIHKKAVGLHAHYVLVNREAGDVTFVGVWDSEDALRDVAAELEPARARLWSALDEEPPVEVYKVADGIERP